MANSDPVTLTDATARVAEIHLATGDKVMAKLISMHGRCQIPDNNFQPFRTLATSIISQQLSSRAADSIERRVRKIIGGALTPMRIFGASSEDLRSAGLSGAKVRYLSELARRIVSGELDFRALKKLSDAQAIEALIELPGVGRWTAEMFLIFALKRPDVLSLGDAGLRRAAKALYDNDEFEQLSACWYPYRSVASWYLWRHIDS